MIFSYFWGKMHLFLGSLWRALHWNATPPVLSSCLFFCFTQTKINTERQNLIDIFVWRLDCRLKYICYLLVIKCVIFGYFWGKIRLFLRSLWRALHWNATPPPVFVQAVLLLSINNNNTALNENMIDILAWRLDCRLKYVWYLILIKFVIFGYF